MIITAPANQKTGSTPSSFRSTTHSTSSSSHPFPPSLTSWNFSYHYHHHHPLSVLLVPVVVTPCVALCVRLFQSVC